MWRTSIGERVLRGDEWEVFRQGLWALWDRIEMSFDDADSWPAGVQVFDRLTAPSKLAMLAMVGKALHDEAVPCLPLTALTEGTFAAVYEVIREIISIEIDASARIPRRRKTIPLFGHLCSRRCERPIHIGKTPPSTQSGKTTARPHRPCPSPRARIPTRRMICSKN